jgi:hypothetical protein
MVVLFMGLHGSWVCTPPKPDPLMPDAQIWIAPLAADP